MSLKGSKIVVTGGAGFIGSRLTHYLLNKKAKVLIVDNLSTGKKELISSECIFLKLDIRSKKLKEVVENFKPSFIIHLAAIHYIPYCNANPEETFDVNVMGTRNLLEASEGVNFLFASSAAVYSPLNKALTEEDPCEPIDIYGKTKLIGEDLVKYYCEKAIIARIFNVYGPNDANPHLIPEIVNQVKKGKHEITLGNLEPKRDFIYVDDVCMGIIALLEHSENGTYNIGSGVSYSVKEVVKIVSEILGEEISIIQDQKKMRKIEREQLLADITKIQSRTGWSPKVNFKQGLKELLNQTK